MQVEVQRVEIPAMSTIGYGFGIEVETHRPITFAGDHRPMRDLGEAVAAANQEFGQPIIAEVEDWQVF